MNPDKRPMAGHCSAQVPQAWWFSEMLLERIAFASSGLACDFFALLFLITQPHLKQNYFQRYYFYSMVSPLLTNFLTFQRAVGEKRVITERKFSGIIVHLRSSPYTGGQRDRTLR